MKQLSSLLIVFSLLFSASAQTFINETFSGTVPPSGWTIDAHASNWKSSGGNVAGGTAPECMFDYNPSFTGLSSLISPQINLTGITTLKLMFGHSIDHYGGVYTVGVATRSGGGAWNTVWSKVNPTGNLTEFVDITINNANVGASDFQIAWFFNGNSENIDYWYIDDILLFAPLQHDVGVKSILTLPEYNPYYTLIPQATLINFGLTSETFNATCIIKANGTTLYTQNCNTIVLGAGVSQTVSFPNFVLNLPEEIYEITVTTNLSGDMNTSNDTKVKTFDTYTTSREMVILEIGTGTWCPYCPGAAMGAHDLLSNGKSVGVIKYHNSDSFTNTYSNARNSYYGISAFPTAIFDGVLMYVGGSNTQTNYPYYLPIYESRKSKKSAYTLEIFGTHSGYNYTVQLRIKKVATVPASYNNLVVHLALTESNITYSWQGQTQLHNVERLMIPNQNGTSLNFAGGNEVTITLPFTVNASWAVNNLELVAFVQNLNGKEILQGKKEWLQDIEPMPAVPAAPILIFPPDNSSVSYTSVQFKWRKAESAQFYKLEIALDSLFNSMVFQDSSLTDTVKSFSGLSPDTHYFWRVKGKNFSGWGPYSSIFGFNAAATFSLTVSLNNGWNMVSIPGLLPSNQNVTSWWPGKDPATGVFKFNQGYQMVTTAVPTVGYWMKNIGAQIYNTGDEWPSILLVPHDSILVINGWNMFGVYECPVPVTWITTTPPGILQGQIYKFSAGYQPVDTLYPGYGYWAKILPPGGAIHLPNCTLTVKSEAGSLITSDYGKIIITDKQLRSYTLYTAEENTDLNQFDLPPLPPDGVFDIRYSTQRYVEKLNSTPQGIEITGAEYPLKIKAEAVSIILSDETGKLIAKLNPGEEFTLNVEVVGKLLVEENFIPSVYSLGQNYPNPFNPGTTIEFRLPEDVQNVKLNIYTALGEKIVELINTGLRAGVYKYYWDASDAASGLYIYELVAGNFTATRKMILLK